MGTLAVQSFADRLRSALKDTDSNNRRWTDDDVVQYVSDGQRAAVQLRPEINPKTASHQLVAGTKQSIPDEAFNLLNVVRNMGSNGTTPGRVIKFADFDDMNSDPDWHTKAAADVVKTWLYDAKSDRRTFYVYPQQPSSVNQVELQFSKIPDELDALNDLIELDDIYQPVLWYYTLFRAYNKEVNQEGVSIDARASAYYTAFISELTGGLTSEARLDPATQTLETRDMPPPAPGQ